MFALYQTDKVLDIQCIYTTTAILSEKGKWRYSAMLRPGSRVCNSMRKITEIVKDYGGVANGCQLTEVWPGGQKTSNEG